MEKYSISYKTITSSSQVTSHFQVEKSFDEERDDQLVMQLEQKIASHVSSFQKFIENL